ncbi:MAG: 30S ribosomal protein S2 [Planctomycetota bacterium]
MSGANVLEPKTTEAKTLVQELVAAGVHFGHRASLWNPKMAPYVYARKNQIHIIDIRETMRGLLRAQKYLNEVASNGSLVLFVGTKRQAAGTIEREALRCGMPFVAERWLGGALTNFRTIRSRLGRLEELEELRASDRLAEYSKKMQSALAREYRKMYRNLNGLRTMNRLPECLVVVDPRKEKNAVREARRLGTTTIALIDTDCDPDLVDLPIPGNDDGIRSIELVMRLLADAVLAGKSEAALQEKASTAGNEAAQGEGATTPETVPPAAGSASQAPPPESAGTSDATSSEGTSSEEA